MNERLTERQLECLRLSATMTDKDIGRYLSISHHTVSLHIREAMRRLGASSRKAALRHLAYDPLYASDAIPSPPVSIPPEAAPGDQVNEAQQASETARNIWPLPPPPGRSVRIGLIIVFAAIAALITVGIVNVVSGAVGAIAPHAPPTAILTQE